MHIFISLYKYLYLCIYKSMLANHTAEQVEHLSLIP
jgi:hypothetical protein